MDFDYYTVTVDAADQRGRAMANYAEKRKTTFNVSGRKEMERLVKAFRAIGVEPTVTTEVTQPVEVK